MERWKIQLGTQILLLFVLIWPPSSSAISANTWIHVSSAAGCSDTIKILECLDASRGRAKYIYLVVRQSTTHKTLNELSK